MLPRGPGTPVYLTVDGVRHWFPNSEMFKAMGYEDSQVIQVGWDELLAYPAGDPLAVIASELHDGALVKGSGKDVYLVEGGRKRRITNWSVFLSHGWREVDIAHVSDSWLLAIPNGNELHQ